MKKKLMPLLLAGCMLLGLLPTAAFAASRPTGGTSTMYGNNDFIEIEQPELTMETKQLISLYQRKPSEENYINLRAVVIDNYNAVLDRKEAKLAELQRETAGKPGGKAKVAEMEEIVQEMYMTYWNRINSSMLRFTDPRLLKWQISNASQFAYIPVMGAGNSIYVKRTPVTNAEYAEFILATGTEAPSNWENGTYSAGEADYPVNYISYQDAEAYCAWLTASDGVNIYRLPNESEWELAAGHMPKDAAFNCGVSDGRTSVEQYADVTRGAHGAIDFWGNVWEWTSTVRSDANGITTLGVKGGAWSSARTDCRTEYRKEGRDASIGYQDVGFRVLQILNGEEPDQKVELATLEAPAVSASAISPTSVELNWQSVNGAIEYQIFSYSNETRLISMLDLAEGTSLIIDGLEPDTAYSFIVQPISYIEISDNVSGEYSVSARTQGKPATVFTPMTFSFATIKAETTAGSKITVRLSSTSDVTAVNVNGVAAEKIFEGTKRDVLTWKVVLSAIKAGNYSVEAIAYDKNGNESAPVVSNVAVASRGNGKSTQSPPSIDVYDYNGMNYLLYTPANATENMPLIVYLHGYESKGDDPSQLVETDSFSKWLYEGQFGDVPAYVLIPQLSSEQRGWVDITANVMELINAVVEAEAIDRTNISLTGFSIGGGGVWVIGAAYSNTFARIAPCAGTAMLTKRMLANLTTLDIQTFIGSADTVVNPQNTKDCAEALSKLGASIQVIEFDGATHTQVPELAYLGTDLIQWLLGK